MIMQDSTRPCAHCGDTFTKSGKPYSMASTYCPPCAIEYRAAYRSGLADEWHAARVTRCPCGSQLPNGYSKYCSRECGGQYVPVEPKLFTCAATDCHHLCRSSKHGAGYCSNACRLAAKTVRRGRPSGSRTPHWLMSRSRLGPTLRSWPMFGPTKAPRITDRPCVDCGEMMPSAVTARKRCDECGRIRNIDRSMRLYETAYSTGKVKQAMHWRYELIDYLRERDGDKCALCSKRMRFDVTTGPRGESDQGATIDHILPRSFDGSNDLANLQLAHWACNRAKSNRGAPEQLRLVG